MTLLQPVKTIEPRPWMKSKETRQLMRVLSGFGEMPLTLFVGGCVRNTILEKGIDDIDLATQFTPDEVTSKLEKAGVRVIPTGIDHGTVTAVIEGRSYEVTTLRNDIRTDGRHAEVSFSKDWQEDARRRDFTMNTLLMSIDGQIFDPVGRGLADLQNRKVLFVGEPEKRVEEDYLRILRYFRFHTLYGEGEPDEEALRVCRAQAGKLKRLSKERLSIEFFKILSVDSPVETLNVLFDNNILQHIAAFEYSARDLAALCRLQAHYKCFSLPARLLVLCALSGETFYALEKDLVLTGKIKAAVKQILAGLSSLCDLSDISVKRLIYKYKKDIATQCLFMFCGGDTAELAHAMSLWSTWKPPIFPLSGHDLMNEGMSAGPDLGKRLNAVEMWWIEEDFLPDKEACLAFSRKLP